jgi:hypothetical protein
VDGCGEGVGATVIGEGQETLRWISVNMIFFFGVFGDV